MRILVVALLLALVAFAGCTEEAPPPEPISDDQAEIIPEPDPEPEPEAPAIDAQWINGTTDLEFTRGPSSSFGSSCVFVRSVDNEPITIHNASVMAEWAPANGRASELFWAIEDGYGDYEHDEEPGPSPLSYHDDEARLSTETNTITTSNGESTVGPSVDYCLTTASSEPTVGHVATVTYSFFVEGEAEVSYAGS